jgi:hypothetical protein
MTISNKGEILKPPNRIAVWKFGSPERIMHWRMGCRIAGSVKRSFSILVHYQEKGIDCGCHAGLFSFALTVNAKVFVGTCRKL